MKTNPKAISTPVFTRAVKYRDREGAAGQSGRKRFKTRSSLKRAARWVVTLAIVLASGMGMTSSYFKVEIVNAQAFETESARQADEFIDSIGVNVHLHYNDTAYGEYER